MSPAINNDLHVANVVKTFGAHGELLIRLRPEAPEEINVSEPVFITIDGYAVPFYFKRFEARGNHRALVVFDDMESMELAQELVGKTIIRRTSSSSNSLPLSRQCSVSSGSFRSAYTADCRLQLPTEGEVGVRPLHYSVIDKKAGEIGVVAGFIDIPGNPCLQLQDGTQEILIPFQNEFMTIDHKKKTITTDLPEGLVDLNRKP
jgi:16S rRNA processing protein RimM